jgi:hypothetical protein
MSTKSSSLLASVNQVTTQSHPNPSSHRTKYLRSLLDPSSFHYNTKPSTVSHRDLHLSLQALHSSHKALIQHHIDALPIALRNHMYFTSTSYLFIHTKVGLSMGKPTGRHPFSITLSPKTQKGPKNGSSFHDFHFAFHSIFDKMSKSQKWSNMTKCSSKLGQGQQAPNTHL